VLPIRNLNTKEALVYETKKRIQFMHRNAIDCEVLTGTERNKRILFPRINLTYSGTYYFIGIKNTKHVFFISFFIFCINFLFQFYTGSIRTGGPK
jgi:hypothetical protein